MAQADPSRSTGRDTGTNPAEGFGLFKVNLAKHLDFPIIQQLSILLVLEHREIDSIKRSETPGLEMVNLLDERGIITHTDISDLLKMLGKLELAGLAARIRSSFQTNTSQAKKDQDLYLEGFARFKVDLAEHLDFPTIQRLSTLLVLKPGEIGNVKRSKTPGLEMVNLLDNQGFITPSDITEFLKKLKELGLASLAARIQESFQAKTSQAKKDQDLYLEGFAHFKVDLAEHLDFPTIQRLSTLLGLKPEEIDSIKRSETPGLEMVNLLDNQGFITPSDITDLLKMLKELGLASLAAIMQESFQAKTSQAKRDQDLEGFGLFKVNLAEHLDFPTIQQLSILLGLKPEEIDSIKRSKTPGLEMVNLLDERGFITPTDISDLLKMLRKLKLAGLTARIQSSFQTNTSQAKRDQDLEEKKRDFIKYSKTAYRKYYETAKPFPSMSKFSVNSIFVEGGIYYLAQEGDSMQKPDVLEPLESYNDILSSPKTKSMRKIIEGDPGYGKSTLASQLVYDWCTEDPESPLKDVEILIFLQLRQLAGVNSIYTAIKNSIVPKDEDMDEACIKEILKVHKKSVVMLFDSYDEYADKNETETDIFSIIEMKMFLDILVIILTRTLILPPNLHPETKRIRLTGFGEAERRNYVLKAVADDVQLADRIEKELQISPILRDLCQVPLFSTMFAHIAHERPEIEIFSTVTRFFTYVITCVHNHMKIKKDASTGVPAFETELAKLYRIAFDGLTQKNQQLTWEKTYLVSELGEEFYDNFIKLGMLAQEVVDIPKGRYKTEARIWHKIICEFYASHHLVWILSEGASSAAPSINVKETLNSINPFELQYVYRFACGLNKSAGDIIIKHLLETKEGRHFAILCMLEQEEKSDQFMQSVKDLVSSIIHITKYDAILIQRSTIQVLQVASANQIPISCVHLGGCSPRVDESGLNLILQSGLSLSILSSLQKLMIFDSNRRLTNEELAAILSYSSQCTSLKVLWFVAYDLQDTIPVGSIPSSLKSRNVKVWNFIEYGLYSHLNLQTGQWQACDNRGNLPGEEGYIEPRSSEDDTDEEASGDDEERQPAAYVTTSHYNQPAEKRPAPDEFDGGNFKWARRK